MTDILAAHPTVQGILFDLPDVSAAAQALLDASGAAKRCTLLGGSFFEAVPAGADAYLLKHILHDWDDRRATSIISNCRRAMARDAALLIIERVLPERAEQGRAAAAILVHLEMLSTPLAAASGPKVNSGRVRLAAAFATATRVVPTEAPVTVIEARAI